MGAVYKMEVAFSEAVAGVFTLESALDGPDVLIDVSLSDGTYTDVSVDAQDPYQIVFGTDNLMGETQAANLTVTVGRPDDPGYWNPANPDSPLASETPGLVSMRPVRLTGVVDGVEYPMFAGYTSRGNWDSTSRCLQLYCEDWLLWASRIYPTIDSTGPIRMGAVFVLLGLEVDSTQVPIADDGILLPDFSADGSLSVTQILANLLEVDLGTVYVARDGTPVYRQADYALAQPAAASITVTRQMSEEQTGFDVEDINTRVTVEQLDDTGTVVASATRIDADAEERRYGRSDIPTVSSTYVANPSALAAELVYRGVRGKPPATFTLADVDDTTLRLILESAPLSVYTVDDPFAGTNGDVIVQRIEHTITTGHHEAEYLCMRRAVDDEAFTLDTPLDSTTARFRYP